MGDKLYRASKFVDGVRLAAIASAPMADLAREYQQEPLKVPSDAVRLPPDYISPVFSVGFAVPLQISATDLKLGFTKPGTDQVVFAWELPSKAQSRLAVSPNISVTKFSLPKTAVFGESFMAEIEVENTGDRSGTFVSIVGAKNDPHKDVIKFEVPTNEVVTEKVKMRYPSPTLFGYGEPDTTVTYELTRGTEVVSTASVEVIQ
ncbi:hypothetical protein [Halobaculum sp. EA56]|uniref:hypothetical protein n=1 Tax=Halobaculum sp. EA56 TaxID=3421648 RepID=UPI003EC0DD67